MNTSVRARHDARGFSFIELLVTIIIAGIAFAALVPVFVSAQKKGAGDNARNQALSLARDKLEKIRALDYDQIFENNLNSSTWFGGQFGQAISVSNGGGAKTYTVDYSVVFVVVGGQGDGHHDVTAADAAFYGNSEKYKQVTVSVSWTGNPKPVKTVVLSTSIYKQYQGSRINDLVVSPLASYPPPYPDQTRMFVQSLPATFTAYVNDADASRTSKVTFLVYNSSGLVATLTCPPDGTSSNGVYAVTWNPGGALGALDGTYTVKATATNINGYAVNTVTAVFSLETGPPPQVSGATALGYIHEIDLAWSNTTAGDVAQYWVTRMNGPTPTGTPPPTPTYPSTPTYKIDFTQGPPPVKIDSGLDTHTPGYQDDTPYVAPGRDQYRVYYQIVTVDSVGNRSAPVTVSAIPHSPTDTVAPTTPTNFTGTVSPSPPLWVTLTWGFSTDPPSPGSDPTSGMNGYRVYRRNANPYTFAWTSWAVITTVPQDTIANPTTYTWTDSTVKPLVQYQYYVAAIDNALNQSVPTPILPSPTTSFQTPNYAYNYLTVQNVDNTTRYNVTLTNIDGTAIDSWPWPAGSWTTSPFPTSPVTQLAKENNGVKDYRHVYLPVGFTFKINYQATTGSDQSWHSKLVTITTTTLVTINGSTYSTADIP